MNLLLSPSTVQQFEMFLRKPSNSVLLVGAHGSGKTAAALYLSSRLLQVPLEVVQQQPYVRIVAPGKKSVLSIEDIREVQAFLQLKTIGTALIRRIVILEESDGMTIEAQNAFLKTLEEPPADSVIILLTVNEQKLLATIRSRCSTLQISPISWEQAYAYYKDQHSEADIKKNYLLSEGQASLLHALLEADSEHALVTAISRAKAFLAASQFERLALLQELEKGEGLDLFLLALSKVSHAALAAAAEKRNTAAVARWNTSQKVIQDCIHAINQSAISKLQLTHLCLSI